ncbi:TIGR03557 family F420-dependent LLM class oxidoreductase [Nocardioides pocheonensis]|uniref:TIGR03557 family F420-dependent LLM class oxidoreductase n=1 Tax=Nocardioides pocheonensis TaxID=661485 RepID=A0A3N0GPF4_9ACTN|nr:TIGR03557 family F420-dependent LLM class oxidoreductase [Nocardioides pocheonensis]RNM14297.1 TIGR03557 family F420-dependent LLM class oxidoreductase [Nocardioides pocheonensis]
MSRTEGGAPTFGYFLSTEEYTPQEIVEQARLAEEAGFEALWISDHFHPWNDEQGQAPFVWSLIGAISQVCRLPVTTAVTCPTMRISPVIVAQAAATAAVQLEGRFRLGLGSGEALNEHVLGDPWPVAGVRLAMLEEAVGLIRELWQGDFVDHHGAHFTAEQARIYTRPEQAPEIYVSGFGPEATRLAARVADGYITTAPDRELPDLFRTESGDKPVTAGFKVAWAPTKEEGVEQAHRLWPNSALPGELAQVLPSPRHFEQASRLVTREMIADAVPGGPDAETHRSAFEPFLETGFDEIYVGNMGPHYAEMIGFYGAEVLPGLRRASAA